MYYTGFADEASVGLDGQIKATKALGWKYIESRAIDGTNIHDLPEDKFEEAVAKLEEAGVMVNCFGSAVANWGWDPLKEEDFQKTAEQLKRAIARMKRLNCKMIRGMSFKALWERPAWDKEIEENVFRKVNALVRMCEEADILYLHENCNNYGGMSWKHTLKLLDNVKSPNFKLVFDTGNPVLNFDRSEGDALDRCRVRGSSTATSGSLSTTSISRMRSSRAAVKTAASTRPSSPSPEKAKAMWSGS
ncbi:sugar phosphate isomerase/epimerase family protein [Victivallis vadensis]|uniref:sugar phosphate isomerase/epimerase family protein n=1 Tax=Victivallis vadensis TaxID=172901 RepID=UPI0001572205|nr:sugar phosphate isomerase/epimerase family protein [Victivallis vadensis]